MFPELLEADYEGSCWDGRLTGISGERAVAGTQGSSPGTKEEQGGVPGGKDWMNSGAKAPCQGDNGRGDQKDGAHGWGEVRGTGGWF